mmetsp:Transcript_41073/g.60289  ORF Transcript_41073/g.60289 Transcript_41073/m.60289 type:complete len:147 (+) Transcript_41073:262-702(+)|eukprot:CAMPEP_0195529056 /NCGR_PEP_ID=MMETSP0794_2-20130614/31473_1 /TAXON_ID=515487 /ORGANISM="Stephanopyxis turris, Strain CCMP 815" /LENGTH=146 /DNA_ID=CAMNT_0040660299 /DNA_START=261 /DNA_END=701 /DNA_ORIENTATION=+
MKPAWDQLGDEFADSPSVLVGDVDCTSDAGKPLCEKYAVQGYPTIKTFFIGDEAGEDYSGGRDFDSLKQHVEDKLGAVCTVSDPSDCSDKQKAYIEKMKAKSAEDRQKQLARLDGMKGNNMTGELKKWLIQRLEILKQLETAEAEL